MEHIAKKLRKAYDLIATASNTDIDAYCLAVEEALGYIADALDMVDNHERGRMFEDDGKTKFYIDEEQVSCEKFNDFFDKSDLGWGEVVGKDGVLQLHMYSDDNLGR